MQIIQDLDAVFLQILNVQTLLSCNKFNMGTEKGLFADLDRKTDTSQKLHLRTMAIFYLPYNICMHLHSINNRV